MAAGGLGETLDDQEVSVVELAGVPDSATRGPERLLLAASAVMMAVALHRLALVPEGLVLAVVVVAAIPSAREVFRWMRLARASPFQLHLEQEGLRLRAGSRASIPLIPYTEILSVEPYAWPRPSVMVFREGRMPLRLRSSHQAAQRELASLGASIVERIRHLPDGMHRCEAIAERKAAGARVFRTMPWMSLGLGAVLLGLFMLQGAVDATTDLERIVLLGASKGALLLQGDVVRLATPALLHVDPMHLGLNVFFIAMMGAALEGFLGRARLVLLFGLASVLGVLASSLADPTASSAGASPGAMGLMGAFFMMNAKRRTEAPCRLLFPWSVGAALLGIVVSSELLRDDVDHIMHVAGLTSGALIYLLMVHGRRLSSIPTDTPAVVTYLAWAVGGAYFVAALSIVKAAIDLRPDLL